MSEPDFDEDVQRLRDLSHKGEKVTFEHVAALLKAAFYRGKVTAMLERQAVPAFTMTFPNMARHHEATKDVTPPAITAEQVRAKRDECFACPACKSRHYGISGDPEAIFYCHDEHACGCRHTHLHEPEKVVYGFTLLGLLTHPGVNSAAKAAIEEALK